MPLDCQVGKHNWLALAGRLGLDLPHSRTQEAEADKIGIELMARAGYDPNAAITLWQKNAVSWR